MSTVRGRERERGKSFAFTRRFKQLKQSEAGEEKKQVQSFITFLCPCVSSASKIHKKKKLSHRHMQLCNLWQEWQLLSFFRPSLPLSLSRVSA